MEDQLVKAVACNQHVRIYMCSATTLVNEAKERFDLWPCASAALGRTLMVGSMMGSMLKNEQEQLTILINGGGSIGTILVDAYPDGHVRGFVSDPHIHFEYNDTKKLAVGVAVGKEGYLKVTKHLHMRQNWEGIVNLQSGEIGEDFAYYFTMSEQTPSAVSVGVLVDTDHSIIAAGGLIIQMMPDATEADISKTEALIANLPHMSTLIQNHQSLEEIIHTFYDDVKILDQHSIEFRCHCDKESMARALASLTTEELDAMIKEDHGCEITCNFCNNQYHFTEQELAHIKG